MIESTTSKAKQWVVGVVNGQLQLSQGIMRTLAPADGDGAHFVEITTVDLSPITSPSAPPEDKIRLTAEIRDASTRVGFFIIKNHSIDWKIVENAFDAIKEFFDLPMEKKMEIHESKSDSFQGYEEPYCTNVDGLKKGDLKEAITVGYDPYTDIHGVGDAMPELLVRKNLWPNPEHAPKFRPALEAYRAACLKLMRQLIRIIAVAIGEEEGFFDKKSTYPVAGIRALYYPPRWSGARWCGLGLLWRRTDLAPNELLHMHAFPPLPHTLQLPEFPFSLPESSLLDFGYPGGGSGILPQ